MKHRHIIQKNFQSNNEYLLFALALVTFPIVLYVHLNLRSYADDDAYIHFRIVNNFIEYGVPYFNPPEPIMASSSSGWTLLLFLVNGISRILLQDINLPLLVSFLNSIFITLGAVVYTKLFSRLSNNRPTNLAMLLFFIVYISIVIQSSIGLMETVTALLLVGLAFHLLLSNNKYCVILFSISVFFRLELIILYSLVMVYIIATKKLPLQEIVTLSLLGFLPFVIYDLYYFRSLIPNTIKAKSAVYSLAYSDTIQLVIKHLYENFTRFAILLNIKKSYGVVYTAYSLWLILSFIILFAYKEAKILKKRDHSKKDIISTIISTIILFWGVLVLGGYILSRALIFEWYYPLFTVPILLIISKKIMDSQHGTALLFVTLFSVYIFVSHILNLAFIIMAAANNPVYYQDFDKGARVRQYIQIGSYLYDKYPSASLLTSEIGGLGYGFSGYIVDGAGLVSPQALNYHPMDVPKERVAGNIGAIPVGFIDEVDPDIIASYDVFVYSFLKSQALERYVHYKYPLFLHEDSQRTGMDTFWGSKNLNVFINKDYLDKSSVPVP